MTEKPEIKKYVSAICLICGLEMPIDEEEDYCPGCGDYQPKMEEHEKYYVEISGLN